MREAGRGLAVPSVGVGGVDGRRRWAHAKPHDHDREQEHDDGQKMVIALIERRLVVGHECSSGR